MRSPAVNGDTEDLNQVDQASGWDPLTPTASPLDAIARAGAREMLQKALESEVQEFLDRGPGRPACKLPTARSRTPSGCRCGSGPRSGGVASLTPG
jgi:hypothetical protein